MKQGFLLRENQYVISNKKYSSRFIHEDDCNFTELQKEFNDSKGNADLEQITGKWFKFTNTEDFKTDTTALPFGVYSHIPSDGYRTPEHLSPSVIRSGEKYIDMDSLDDLNKDIKLFLNSKPIYDEFQTLYRRGYLLYGDPGNGKTTLIRELTKRHMDDAHIIWCSSVPSDRFLDTLNSINSNKIIVFEEIVNNLENHSLNMSAFLEFMDGEHTLKNCIIIATTNYPYELEANLANRPSRFDMVYNIKNPSSKLSYTILSNLLNREVTDSEFTPKNLSFAQLKEVALLHKMYQISLSEAQQKMTDAADRFKNEFQEKKDFGL